MYRQLLPQILRKFTLSSSTIVAATLLVAGLSGCGNKGDLYLPEDTATTYRTLDSSLTDKSEH
jgi:predicted small lipoprotein YifL